MAYSFAGGVRLGKNKRARQAMIEAFAGPKTLYLRIGTIGGVPYVPAVVPGDRVLLGEPIALPKSVAEAAAAKKGRGVTAATPAGKMEDAATRSEDATAKAAMGKATENEPKVSDKAGTDEAAAVKAFTDDITTGEVPTAKGAVADDAVIHGTAADGVPSSGGAVTEEASVPEQGSDPVKDGGAQALSAAKEPQVAAEYAHRRCGVYASAAGTVLSVEETAKGYVVAIRRSREQPLHPDIKPYPVPLQKIPPEDIVKHIKKYAVSGRDGLTAKKLEAAQKNGVRHFVVDLTDPEPSLTYTYRLSVENTEAVLGGIKILLMGAGLRRADIAVEADKRALCRRIRQEKNDLLFHVVPLQPKFPQSDARELISAVYGTALGTDKDLTKEGYVIFRASECADVYTLFAYGMPPIHRVVSVTGDCMPGTRNLLLPVGTPFADIAAAMGGFSKNPVLITENGGLRGRAVSADACVGMGTAALLFSSAGATTKRQSPCIRCGRCVSACPARIEPYRIAAAMEKNRYGEAKRMDADACLQCGTCTFVCPASIPLAALVREAKQGKKPEPASKKQQKHKNIR